MNNGLTIKIDYCRYSEPHAQTVVGLEEFRREIENEYISVIHKHLIGRGGGVYDFTIELITNVQLVDVLKWLSQGMAFDVLKWGTSAFVLKPFWDALRKLRLAKQQDTNDIVDIGELKIVFQDSIVIINKIRGVSFFDSLEKILRSLAEKYDALLLEGKAPFTIFIPVFEDSSDNRVSRFRQLLGVDETIYEVEQSDYFRFWGLQYQYTERRVFDVQRSLLIDERFYTEPEYWVAVDMRRKGDIWKLKK